MAQQANCLVAYRENPHTDACAMAVHAAELLQQALERGRIPTQYCRHAGVMWPPTGVCTSDAPMRELEALARKLEADHPNFFVVNVVGGFAFADTPDTGVSFSVSTVGDQAEAQVALKELCELAWDMRHKGNAVDPPLEEVMREVAQLADGACGNPKTDSRHRNGELQQTAGPVVLVEPSDNIGGGAPGDGTGLLRAFVKHRINNGAICINDPEAVQALQDAAIGTQVTLSIGGKGSKLDEGPLSLKVTLVSRSDGRFELEDRQSHLASMSGTSYRMGPCAVVQHEGITILLTSRKTPPFDLGQWRSQGVDPEKMRVIGVKAAVAHRRAYDKIASRMLWVDTPGPCRSDLTKLPFKKVRRPVFPLDGV
jgi:microcystin degradation protein MlrC